MATTPTTSPPESPPPRPLRPPLYVSVLRPTTLRHLYGLSAAAAATVIVVASTPSRPAGYDTRWQLLWGEQIAGIDIPDYATGPTAHPLIIALGAIFSGAQRVTGLGSDQLADDAIRALTIFALFAAALAVALLTSRIAGALGGGVIAVIVLTRPLVVEFAVVAVFDVLFVAMVVWAVFATYDRRWMAALILLLAAGLIRPEAWLFSLLVVAMMVRCGESVRVPAAALALAAPVLWALLDLVVAGDPLYSFTATRDAAAEVGRDRGPLDAVLLAPARLNRLVGHEISALLLVGLALAVFRRPVAACTRAAIFVLVVSVVAYFLVNAWGTPINARYLLAPALLALPLIGLVFRRLPPNAPKPWGPEQYLAGALLLGLTVTVGIRAASLRDHLADAGRPEARQAAALHLAIDRLAGCRSVSTNDFFVVVDVARRLNLSPAKVRLVAVNGEKRPAVTALAGDGPGRRERIGAIAVSGACTHAEPKARAPFGPWR